MQATGDVSLPMYISRVFKIVRFDSEIISSYGLCTEKLVKFRLCYCYCQMTQMILGFFADFVVFLLFCTKKGQFCTFVHSRPPQLRYKVFWKAYAH